MQRNRSGKIELAAVINLAAAVAALAAVVAAGLLLRQVREDERRARFNAGLDSLWRLSDQWNSPTMLDIRSAAAAGLLAGKASPAVDDVLTFFDELKLLVDREAVDEELAALQFSRPMASYWLASRDYVQKVRHDQPSAWGDVGDLVNRLVGVEARRRQRPVTDVLPTADQVQQFLQDEQGNSECTDDTETQKTPL